jgi:hypothetical protein
MKLVAKTVENAIFKKTGDRVKLHRGEGYWYFSDPDEAPDSALFVTRFPDPSVYTFRLNDLPLELWVESYMDKREALREKLGDAAFDACVEAAHSW